jgi:predicted transcriptional regulator YheO
MPDDLVGLLRPIMKAVAEAVGPHCEVVLHDLSTRNLESTITAIENSHVTGRTVGGPSTNFGLEVFRHEELDHNEYGYRVHTEDGRELRSSSVYLRDRAGHVIGCFTVNVDLTPLHAARRTIDAVLDDRDAQHKHETFAMDINEVLDDLVETAVASTGTPVALMTRDDRVAVMRYLDDRGAFFVKNAVGRVARRLNVSRVTAYNYLELIRGADAAE